MTIKASSRERNAELPSLIHFFGPDGSGKTLQASILTDRLGKHGFLVKRVWLRAHHTLAFLLWKILVKIGFYRTEPNEFGIVRKIPAVNRSKVISHVWSFLEFISAIPIILRMRLLSMRGYHLVAERYILDTVTSVAYMLNDTHFLNGRLANILYRMIPKNTLFIFLDSDYDTIKNRRLRDDSSDKSKTDTDRDETRGYVEPKQFIVFQRRVYKALASSFNALTIDTSKNSIEETSKNILFYLDSSSIT